jgi:guanylate kinase
MKSKIVTITGPSCAGKSTLENYLKTFAFESVISTTTRPMRVGEVDGKSYYFITRSEFMRIKLQGGFIESVEFDGHCYGVSVAEISRVALTGRPIVIVVDPFGHKQIKAYAEKHDWSLFSVFVCNPDEVIAERFLARFAKDVLAHFGKVPKTVATYSSRLAVMMREERSWIAEAWASAVYDLRLSAFDDSNLDSVVSVICNQVAETRSAA